MPSTFVLHKSHPGRARVASNLHAFIDKLPETRSFQVEVKEYRRERTDPQNHALFGVAYPALERETGFTKDELHEAFCKKFFGTVEKVDIFGEVTKVPYRTTTTGPDGKRDVLGTAEFARFYDMVQHVGAESGIYVPDPDPLWREQSAA